MLESTLVTRIRKELTAAGAKAIKIHGGRYQEKGTPDIIACYKGRMVVIEAKVNGKEPTAMQRLRLREWADAGASVSVEREDFDVKVFLNTF